jgi:hypothetical protein
MTDEEDLLVTAGVVGSTIAAPFVINDTDLLTGLASNVEVGINGELAVDVNLENTAFVQQEYFVGASVIGPGDRTVNIESERVSLDGGESGTVSLGPTSTGSLSPFTGGPEPNTPLFPEEGSYDVLVNIFNKRESDPDGSFGRTLKQRLAQQRLNGAITAAIQADADITRVSINNQQVL